MGLRARCDIEQHGLLHDTGLSHGSISPVDVEIKVIDIINESKHPGTLVTCDIEAIGASLKHNINGRVDENGSVRWDDEEEPGNSSIHIKADVNGTIRIKVSIRAGKRNSWKRLGQAKFDVCSLKSSQCRKSLHLDNSGVVASSSFHSMSPMSWSASLGIRKNSLDNGNSQVVISVAATKCLTDTQSLVVNASGWLFLNARLLWKRRYFVYLEGSSHLYFSRRPMNAQELVTKGYESSIKLGPNAVVEKAYGHNSSGKKFRFNIIRQGHRVLRLAAETLDARERWLDALSPFGGVTLEHDTDVEEEYSCSDDEVLADAIATDHLHGSSTTKRINCNQLLSECSLESLDEASVYVHRRHLHQKEPTPPSPHNITLAEAVRALDVAAARAILNARKQEPSVEELTTLLHILFDFQTLPVMSLYASGPDRAALIRMLLRSNPVVGRSTLPNGQYPALAELDLAAPSTDVLDALLKICPETACLDDKGSGDYPMHVACRKLHVEAIHVLLKCYPGSWTLRNHKSQELPLHSALYVPNGGGNSGEAIVRESRVLKVLEIFATHRAHLSSTGQQRLETCDRQGFNILHHASAFHTARVVNNLLGLVYNPLDMLAAKDIQGDTPLHLAAKRVSATESLCAIDVFHALATCRFHAITNIAGRPASELLATHLREPLVANYAHRLERSDSLQSVGGAFVTGRRPSMRSVVSSATASGQSTPPPSYLHSTDDSSDAACGGWFFGWCTSKKDNCNSPVINLR